MVPGYHITQALSFYLCRSFKVIQKETHTECASFIIGLLPESGGNYSHSERRMNIFHISLFASRKNRCLPAKKEIILMVKYRYRRVVVMEIHPYLKTWSYLHFYLC